MTFKRNFHFGNIFTTIYHSYRVQLYFHLAKKNHFDFHIQNIVQKLKKMNTFLL